MKFRDLKDEKETSHEKRIRERVSQAKETACAKFQSWTRAVSVLEAECRLMTLECDEERGSGMRRGWRNRQGGNHAGSDYA